MAQEKIEIVQAERGYVWMTHPELPGSAMQVTPRSLEDGWAPVGWVLLDTPFNNAESATEGSSSDSNPAPSGGTVPSSKSK